MIRSGFLALVLLVASIPVFFNFAGGFVGSLIAAPLSVLSLYVLYKLLDRLWTEKATYTMVPYLWGASHER